MLLKILDVLEKGGHMNDAAEVIDRLLEIDLSNRSKAKLLTRRARLMGSEEGWTAAFSGLLDAVSMEPDDEERIDELMDLLDAQESVPDTLRGRLDAVLSDSHQHLSTSQLLRLAHWHASEGRLSKAIELVETLDLEGETTFEVLDARARLYAERYAHNGQREDVEAATSHRLASLQAIPGEPTALRHLHEILRLNLMEEQALLPLGLLNVLGQASPREVEQIKELSADARPHPFNSELVQGRPSEVAHAVESLLSGLLKGVGQALNQAFSLARSEENEGGSRAVNPSKER